MARSKKDMIALLGKVPLFEGLSRKELESILSAGKEIVHREEHDIVEEGATGVGFHLIVEGEAEVVVGGSPRAKLRAGDYFGEHAAATPEAATVTALTPCVVASCDRATFDELLRPLFSRTSGL
jgi:CRP-like cAMP-binding protein